MIEQIILHLIGDYVTQSHWMATEKTKLAYAAAAHAIVYSLPFLLIASLPAFGVILVTHYLIDRYRLARYLVFAKNWLGDRSLKWADCSTTGYHKDVPAWLSIWLLIAADNALHIAINYAAIRWLP